MKSETTTSILSAGLTTETQITIQAPRNLESGVSTNGFCPDAIELESKDNPSPVTGFAESSESEAALDSFPISATLIQTDDGRYFVDDRLAQELVEKENVILFDDRKQIKNTAAWPYSVQGHLIMKFPNGKRFIGSGTMVNCRHVLTAGHCVYSVEDGGWAVSIQFHAAQSDDNFPFDVARATQLLSVKGWTEEGDSNWDMGMLILDRDLGLETGWFGLITFPSDGGLLQKRVNVTGYPGDKGGTEMWTHDDVIKRITEERFIYNIDTAGGQSGSGIWSTFDDHEGEKVSGIHTTGSSSGNGATRISRSKFDQIISWIQSY